MVVCESTPSPWSWEASVSEGLGFPTYGMSSSMVFGTEGSLSFPDLQVWRYPKSVPEPGWFSSLIVSTSTVESNDPYLDQIEHFARVIRGMEPPLVDGDDALRSLAVIEAIRTASTTDSLVSVGSMLGPDP